MVVLLLAVSTVHTAVAAPQAGADAVFGSGAIVDPGEPGCVVSPGLCSVAIAGTLEAPEIGNGDFFVRFSILWSSAIAHGILGRECAPASGMLTFNASDGSTIRLSQAGTVCEIPVGSERSPMRFDGSFVVVDGTAAMKGLQGDGEVNMTVDNKGNATIQMQGTFRQFSGPPMHTEGH